MRLLDKKKQTTLAASVPLIPDNTTAWEGQAEGVLGQEAENVRKSGQGTRVGNAHH